METGPMVQLPSRSTSGRVASRRLAVFSAFILALVLFAGVSSEAVAQSRIKHVITTRAKGYPPVFGRDLWFTMAQNYDAGGSNGKYYMLYVTSPNNTTVNIQITGSSTQKFAIQQEQVVAFRIPLAWEVTSSGVIENKGIRVWSDNADLTAYLLSRNPYTSDGMLIIPNIGWGKDYVVAGYTSLFELSFDYPSEFCVVANQDNTSAQITPSWDIRASHQPNTVLHPHSVPFSEFFTRGQCAQYQLTQAKNTDDYDVTGSLVSANLPVGVVGASECPNIPPDYTYCDHICDMIPPIRTWAQTYYTAPFINRKGGDSFCAIASADGQTIYRADNTGIHAFAQLNKYSYYRQSDIDVAQKFYSDKPFMLVQYINSTGWPDGGTLNNGIGDPAMVVINAVEQYTPKIIFQTPTILGGQNSFSNFVNILIPISHEQQTKYDNVGIASAPGGTKIRIDNQYEAYRFVNQKPGTHKIVSDTGVGCYIYGYGSYDSYAWSGAFGSRTFNDPDSIPPVVDTMGMCFCAHVTAKDVHVNASKLSSLDSVVNMNYYPDPTFVDGSSRDSSYYDMCVIDSSKPAYLHVSIFDMAGNATLVASTYTPQVAVIVPPVRNFGTGISGQTTFAYDTIVNTGKTNFSLSILKLRNGNRGFSIDPSNDLSPLTPGERRVLKLDFSPVQPQTEKDTIVFGDACVTEYAVLIGNGGAPDFTPTGVDFGCILLGDSVNNTKVTVVNPSPVPVTIDSIWVDDPVHFTYLGTVPIVLPAKTQTVVNLKFGFRPTAINPRYVTGVHFLDKKDGLQRTDSLYGCGIAPSAIFYSDSAATIDCGGSAAYQYTLESHANPSAPTTITTIKHSNLLFKGTGATDQYGTPVGLPHLISSQDSKLFVVDSFIAPAKISGTFIDTITVLDAAGNPIRQGSKDFVTATAIVHYREFSVDQTQLNFGTLAFGGAPASLSFKICNTATEDVNITQLLSGGKNPNAFKFSGFTAGPLKAGECMTVTVTFDPTVNAIDSQSFTLRVETDGCNPQSTIASSGKVKFGVSSAQGYADSAIFACSSQTDNIQVTNANAPSIIDTIISITSSTPNFVVSGSLPIYLPGGSNVKIPVIFTPNPTGGVSNYTTTFTIKVRSRGVDTILVANGSSGAVGMNATISSVFATRTGNAGDVVSLPIALAIVKNGLLAPLSNAGINGVKLVYRYDQDALDLDKNNIAGAVTNMYADWKVDAVKSKLDQSAGTLTIYMNGTTPLADGISSLGNVNFKVTLNKLAQQRFNVTLDSSLLLLNGVTASGCVASTPKSGDFGLVFACGDSTIVNQLNGKKFAGFAEPAHPNPVTGAGHVVTLGYVTRVEGPISLIVYDILGNEVARVVDNIRHEPGSYEVNFDVARLASGTYTYHLIAPSFQGTRQFVVSK
jgi:hypothetical protein